MTMSDQYLQGLLAAVKAPTGTASPAYRAYGELGPVIRSWAGDCLRDVSFSGSYAKGTAIRGGTDVDLFISLTPETEGSLKDLYWKLHVFLTQSGYAPRAQNVSLGVTTRGGDEVDLVPGRKQSGSTTDHSLFRSKADTWTQTNVTTHIARVTGSGRVDEICLLKLWRQLNSLDFPSFLLELTVINALLGRWSGQPASNMETVLLYLADEFPTARVLDPANTNNTISDDLTQVEKLGVAAKARRDLSQRYWKDVLWNPARGWSQQ